VLYNLKLTLIKYKINAVSYDHTLKQ